MGGLVPLAYLLPLAFWVVLMTAAIVTGLALWRQRGRLRWQTRVALATVGVVVPIGFAAALLVLPMVPVLFRAGVCRTDVFDQAASPDGRYTASVVEVDCGAMSSQNRQVLLARTGYLLARTTLLFFNGAPVLKLSWSGRVLTIKGDRSTRSLARKPPDPMHRGGVLARYVEQSS